MAKQMKQIKQTLNLDAGEIHEAIAAFYGLPADTVIRFDIVEEGGRHEDIISFRGVEISYLKDFIPPIKTDNKFGFGKKDED